MFRRKKYGARINKRRVVIAGIGTGGHYFPALVVAQELRERNVNVIFLVRKGAPEEKVAIQYDLDHFQIQARGFFGTSLLNKCISVISIIFSIMALMTLTKGVVGVAFGGFGAIPLIIACLINRSPFFLFEPNRVPGRTTSLFAGKARRVFLGMPLVTPLGVACEITGIPLRPEFKTWGMRGKKRQSVQKTVLFIGGSQGARRLNELALAVRRLLPVDYSFIIVSGKRDFDRVSNAQDRRTRVVAFTFAPWREFAEADIIISRAGALAGYEIMASNKPVIFIPFPFAIDDHQSRNAEYFVQRGNAIVLREESLSEQRLAEMISEHLHSTGEKARLIRDAEKRIVGAIMKEMM